MTRMLAKTTGHAAQRTCRYGCCKTQQSVGHGGRREARVRRWARGAEKKTWKREVER